MISRQNNFTYKVFFNQNIFLRTKYICFEYWELLSNFRKGLKKIYFFQEGKGGGEEVNPEQTNKNFATENCLYIIFSLPMFHINLLFLLYFPQRNLWNYWQENLMVRILIGLKTEKTTTKLVHYMKIYEKVRPKLRPKYVQTTT